MSDTPRLVVPVLGSLGIFPDGGKYAIAFGVFYGVMELVPYIGPILGAIPPIVVALLTHPIAAVWLVLLFIGRHASLLFGRCAV